MMQMTLAAARINKGIKQLDAARKLGVMPQTLRNWEKGKTSPNLEQLKKICKLYGVTPDTLFFGE